MATKHRPSLTVLAALSAIGSAQAADVSQDAIDACIDALRAQVGGGGGQILSTEYSEANSLVMLEDGGGASWRCLVSNDGRDPYLEMAGGGENSATADDGGGAMAGAPTTTEEVVRFPAGRTGTDISGALTPGGSARYVLGARERQMLTVEFWTTDPAIEYQIFLPDGSFLLDRMPNSQRYRGELFVSGDHVVEVINRGGSPASYNMSVTIQ